MNITFMSEKVLQHICSAFFGFDFVVQGCKSPANLQYVLSTDILMSKSKACIVLHIFSARNTSEGQIEVYFLW